MALMLPVMEGGEHSLNIPYSRGNEQRRFPVAAPAKARSPETIHAH